MLRQGRRRASPAEPTSILPSRQVVLFVLDLSSNGVRSSYIATAPKSPTRSPRASHGRVELGTPPPASRDGEKVDLPPRFSP
ncbi:hypothetical protein TIFTF001_055418, partial [Ficus carica]